MDDRRVIQRMREMAKGARAAKQRTQAETQQQGLRRMQASGDTMAAVQGIKDSLREQQEQMANMFETFYKAREEEKPEEEVLVIEGTTNEIDQGDPRRGTFATEADYELPSGSERLLSDPDFMTKVSMLEDKYGDGFKEELFKVMKGESGFNPRAKNPQGSASGLFQFIATTAEGLGVSTTDILRMEPVEQLELYEKYLDQYGYDGSVSLGMMQAAPAFANKSPDTIIYDVGSEAWRVNPGWRTSKNGPITVASIDRYYRRQ